MSSNRSAATPNVELKPSAEFTFVLLLLHAAAAITLALTELNIVVVLMLFLLLPISLYYSIHRFARLSHRHAVMRAVHREEGWLLTRRDGSTVTASLLAESYLHRFFTILRFAMEGRTVCVVIWRDMLDADYRRQLVVALRSLQQEDLASGRQDGRL